MLTDEKKYEVLEVILSSRAFKKTTTSSVLLKLLVKATIEGVNLSAYSIGLELFGKNFDSDKIEVNTRSNVYNLRKKLEKYYEKEGREDVVQLKIETGSYKVLFLVSELEEKKKASKRNYTIGSCLFFFLIGVVLYNFLYLKKDNVWTPLVANKKATTLFLGEVFGYMGKTPFSNRGWIRDFHINSSNDLYEEIRKSPEQYANYQPSDYNYVVFENVLVLKPFTQYFTKHKKDFSIGLASGFETKEIKDKNTIYAGPLFVNSHFNDLFNNFSKNIKVRTKDITGKHYVVEYKKPVEQIDTIIQFKASKTVEYAIASGFRGPDNTNHYMFFSNHGMGLNALVGYFTDDDSLRKFNENFSSGSTEFVSLFKVVGKDRTSLDMELVLFDDNK